MTPSTNRLPLRRYPRHGTLPQLATFEAVLRFGSASRAAEAMCIAQPTLRGRLRKLVEAVDVPLFRIQGRHLAPGGSFNAAASLSRNVRRSGALRDRLGASPPEEGGTQAERRRCATTLAAVPATAPAVQAAVGRTSSANDPVFGRRHVGLQRRLAEAPAVVRQPQDRTARGCACDAAVRYIKPHAPCWRPAQFLA